MRYTTTLDGRDDDAFALWRDGPVAAFAGGNLFKFAPVLGARLAAAIVDEAAEVAPRRRSVPGPVMVKAVDRTTSPRSTS